MSRASTYDKHPFVQVSASASQCEVGWTRILERLKCAVNSAGAKRSILCVECYPGVFIDEIKEALEQGLNPARVFDTREHMKSSPEIDRMLEPYLTDDPVFGRINGIRIDDFFDSERLAMVQVEINKLPPGLTVIIGTGASLFTPHPTVLVFADMARWEIQMRQRRGEIGNLGVNNLALKPSLKYKRAFFVEWRAADRLKKQLLPRIDFLIDTNDARTPKLITAAALRQGLAKTVKRPFRVVPFFDPGLWGGEWMRAVCDLPNDAPNYAWCFDCVPEENSLLLGYGDTKVEIPSINLVFAHPRELLGEAVHARFGTEFPIRFDFLDTVDGGNLSLQVHPLTEYIQERFGMNYTQDESYYMLDAKPDAVVYLGLREGINYEEMITDLRRAQEDVEHPFPAEKYVNEIPARKHDHFLIPAGTIHCSGRNSMVLEISATPYIFTFKLWDWGRLGLDGRPRPIHLDHGAANIETSRTTEWVYRNLVNQFSPISEGEGWCEERTGLHEREFIETRRHWFTGKVPHDTCGGVNVLNLVEGNEVVVESPTETFVPFIVHYAETFIVPAAVGAYTIRPTDTSGGKQCATIKAFVRT